LRLAVLDPFWHQWHKSTPGLQLSRSGDLLATRLSLLRLLLFNDLLRFADPAFHSNLPINGICFGKPEINRRTKRVQRDFSLPVPFSAGDLRSTESAGTANLDSESPEIHGCLNGLFHRAAERDAALNLEGDIFRDQLRIQLRGFDFLDIDLD